MCSSFLPIFKCKRLGRLENANFFSWKGKSEEANKDNFALTDTTRTGALQKAHNNSWNLKTQTKILNFRELSGFLP